MARKHNCIPRSAVEAAILEGIDEATRLAFSSIREVRLWSAYDAYRAVWLVALPLGIPIPSPSEWSRWCAEAWSDLQERRAGELAHAG